LSVSIAIARIQGANERANFAVQKNLRKIKDQIADLQALLGLPQNEGNEQLYSPIAQAQIRDFIKAYIIVMAAARGQISTGDFDTVLNQLGQEAVPALVDGVNIIAGLGLGDC
jgi:hypothetical protein